jgi:predicted DNA-binding transcriptional regulator AlpA
MTHIELAQLPPLVDLPTAASVLGIGRGLAYELVRTGAWPTPVVRMGKLIRIPTACLQRVLDGDVPVSNPDTGHGR